VTQTLMSVGAAAYWYPNLARRFYLRGGAAIVMHRASDGTDVVTSSGIGPQLGVGYEYTVSRAWRVAPFAHYSVGVVAGDVKFNGGQAAPSGTVSFLQVGVNLTRR
jgi:outer membrane autotransporter protein